MHTQIDFSKIRSYNGSQHNGFEELICQIAHLEMPKDAKYFNRKEGAGGDAGVECYWVLNDESEIGWQAKYFPDGMTSSRWSQLDESFNSALEKHEKLKKYIVCLPLDKSDSRKKTKNGKSTISFEDEWNSRIEKWKKKASEQKRKVEFEYWGKHEITLFLTNDNPLYSGRCLYWFNEPVLTMDLFKKIATSSEESLGERYTPEFHVDLPIVQNFNGICHNKIWKGKICSFLHKTNEKAENFFREFEKEKNDFFNQEQVNRLKKTYNELITLIPNLYRVDYIASQIVDDALSLTNQILSYRETIIVKEKKDALYKNENTRNDYRKFFLSISNIDTFLMSKEMKAARSKTSLLYGEGGVGKSHLLCDLCLNRIENEQPTIFILGQHYEGGNPLVWLKQSLDLKNVSNSQLLGALDSIGEAYNTRTLIAIDAINEGIHRDDWSNHIRRFISDLSPFKNISIIFSCRTTYVRHLIPDSINEDSLPRFEHPGFQGFEHRAAEKYLSKQGISKPSAPILAPEFSNPLFLKTCCKAIKDRGMTSFPKGLQGISSLFDFYMRCVDENISRRKKYTPEEQIAKTVLVDIANQLFPNCLSGIPKYKARTLINVNDPNPNYGDSLFDELLHFGVISEDMIYENEKGKPVIRFTYERFSDQIVAEQILDNFSDENIQSLFSSEQVLGKALKENKYYKFSSIFEALAIIVPEKYNIELDHLFPDEHQIDVWWYNDIFQRTIIQRAATSFSDETLSILNDLDNDNYSFPALDILLKLSTEPDHPWNAELIHKNLYDMSMAERDRYWSVHIAIGDQVEGDGEPESIVRTLIEWSCFGEICETEEERLRLCCVVLFWFLTTSNRKVRDQTTKSLVRVLTSYPHLLISLINKFQDVNDMYLLERLYAVIYGVVCNIRDDNLISKISEVVYHNIFEEGNPIPHILLRDYARGILELAHSRKILSNKIKLSSFRPPYKSNWPPENPSHEEIEKIVGEEKYSNIKDSLMGFPGDFGRYTMGCIHDWSPDLLSEESLKTGYDYKKQFAEDCLKGELKERFLSEITPNQLHEKEPKSIDEFLKELESYQDEEDLSILHKKQEREREEKNNLKQEIIDTLTDEKKEYFRWLMGLTDHLPAAFSRKWAQRWICKRAYELGWTNDLFGEFEQYYCSYGRGGGHGNSGMERIGKKYQWIAFHEFLAYLSDNVHWIDRGYLDIKDEKYYGPWQVNRRDIDPTIWIRKNGEYESYFNEENTWWSPYRFKFPESKNLSVKEEFLWSRENIPDFVKNLFVLNPKNNTEWIVLKGFWHQMQDKGLDTVEPKLDVWFRINSIIIEKQNLKNVLEDVRGKALVDPHVVSSPNNSHEGFWGEYPWHVFYSDYEFWSDPEESFYNKLQIKYLNSVFEYSWENGSTDHSQEHSLNFYMPNKDLIVDMELSRSTDDFGSWVNNRGEIVFCDPSISEYGASYALIKKDLLKEWLDAKGLEIVWLIGGEKQLYSSKSHNFFGRLTYSGSYYLVNEKIEGDFWFIEEGRK